MKVKKVFISHSHVDNNFCQKLAIALREQNMDVWFDETNLHTGSIINEIQLQLDDRDIFIVVLSPAAFASSWVKEECLWAYTLQKQDDTKVIIPIVSTEISKECFSGKNGWLFLYSFKRLESSIFQPYSIEEAITKTIDVLEHLEKFKYTPSNIDQFNPNIIDLIRRQELIEDKHSTSISPDKDIYYWGQLEKGLLCPIATMML